MWITVTATLPRRMLRASSAYLAASVVRLRKPWRTSSKPTAKPSARRRKNSIHASDHMAARSKCRSSARLMVCIVRRDARALSGVLRRLLALRLFLLLLLLLCRRAEEAAFRHLFQDAVDE